MSFCLFASATIVVKMIIAVADAHEPTWDPETNRVSIPDETRAFLEAQREGGFTLLGADVEDGGLGLSLTASTAVNSIISCGFTSGLGGFYALTHCAANLIKAHGTTEQKEAYVRPLVEGKFGGTMALSEAQSGSSLSDLKAKARHVQGDEYRLSGSKMWTSGFDHDCFENIVHLVLAKIEGEDTPQGNRGISLFIVPKILPDGTPNDVALNGLNHKMGQRALPNSYWSMEDGCVGYLVGGAKHAGLMQMFTMMRGGRVRCLLCVDGVVLRLSRRRRRGESVFHAGTTCASPSVCTRPAAVSEASRRAWPTRRSGFKVRRWVAKLRSRSSSTPTSGASC